MFRMYGRKVEILKYQISYQENEEERTDYAVSEEEANEIAERVNGTVSALPDSGDAWMDGIEVDDVPDTYAEAMRIYQTHLNGLQYAKNIKIKQLSETCNTTINAGTQVELSDGSTESFSYDLADQSNVSEMFNAVLLGATEYPYHANNDDCRMYSAQDITTIYVTLSSYKTAQTTYHNQLKKYVKALETAEEINAVVYGQELTGAYLEKYNELMAQAKVQLDNIVAKVQNNEFSSKND